MIMKMFEEGKKLK